MKMIIIELHHEADCTSIGLDGFTEYLHLEKVLFDLYFKGIHDAWNSSPSGVASSFRMLWRHIIKVPEGDESSYTDNTYRD